MNGRVLHRFVMIVLLMVLGCSCSLAQPAKIDSLKNILKGSSGKERLGALYALANILENVYPKEGLQYALEGIPLAQSLGDSSSMATLYSSAAFSSSELGDIKQSMAYAYRSLEIATRIGDKKRIASAHSTLGIAFVYIGQYSKALEHHFEALRLREELHLDVASAGVLNNIGIVYHRLGEYDKSIEYYKRSLDRQGAQIGELTKVRLLTNIGYSEYKRGNFDAAMRYHTEARKLAEEYHYTSILAYIYFNIGIMQSEMRDPAAALVYLNRALGYYEELGQKNGALQLLNALGRTYYKLGEYRKAQTYLQRAVVLGTQLNAPDEIKASYETLYAMYEKTGPQSMAYQYLKLYSAAKDTLFNSMESKKITELALQNATISSEHEIERLKNEKTIADLNLERQKYHTNLIIGIMAFLSVVIVLMYLYNRSTRKSKLLVEEKNHSLKKLNAELQEKIVEVKALSGLLPICASCKKIRDDKGYWEQLEGYISKHSDATFSHGICPDCMKSLYPKYMKRTTAEE